MSTKTKVIIVIVYTAVAVASGRYLTPEKVKIETKVVEADKKTDTIDNSKNKHQIKKTTVTVNKKPTGEETIVTNTTVETVVDDKKTQVVIDQSSKKSDDKETKTAAADKITISALAGANLSSLATSPFVYGLSITRPILGPVTLGLWGLSNASCGVSVGLTF